MKQVTCHGQRDPLSLTLPLQHAYEVRLVGSLCAARRSAPDWPTATEPIRPQAAMSAV